MSSVGLGLRVLFSFSFSANIIIASRLNSLVLEKYKLTDIICPNDGTWSIKTNEELEILIKRKNIVRFIK